MISTSLICTAGFNVQSVADAKPYVLTAGHCMQYADTWRTEFEDGSRHVIGNRWSSYFASDDVDAGLLGISAPGPDRWNPQPWVLVRASYGTPPTVADYRYDITAVGGSVVGSYICKTGITTGTVCGVVKAVGQDHPNNDTWNMGVANILNCGGDSGGPLYKGGRAYGITSSGSLSSYIGELTYDTGLGVVDASCYTETWYTGASKALSITHTKLLGT